MEEPAQYHVMDVDGNMVGPVSSAELAKLVEQWCIGPDSPIRPAEGSNWTTFRDVATSIGIQLPETDEWEANRKAAIANEKSNIRWGCAVFLVLFWVGMNWIGFGFLVVPIVAFSVLYYTLCKLFSAMTGLEVFWAPMWSDMRKKRIPGQGWQFLALILAMFLVVGYYLYRIYG